MISVGIIGCGYWGPNLVRNFVESDTCQVVAVSDLQTNRLAKIQKRYPNIQITTDYRQLLANPAIDAVAISTPVSTHFHLAMAALESGKHVLVEKPFTSSYGEAVRLNERAERSKLVLMVDHTFVYTGAVRKIREIIAGGMLGEIYYYDSVRINLGLFQHDVDVIWDLAVHDLAIMDHVIGARPCAIAATGIKHLSGGTEDIAYLTIFFENSNLIAHVNVNWLSPVKVRRTLIGGSKQMIVYDDMDASEKVKVYDKGITVIDTPESAYKLRVGYRAGDMYAPQLDVTEALRIEVAHFAECVEHSAAPITGGMAGLRVVQILEAATQSMRDRGRLVELPTVTALCAEA